MTDHLARIRRAFRGGRRPSELYWFYWDNWDSIPHTEGRTSWKTVTDSLNGIGLRTEVLGEKRPITIEVARQTYYRVKKDKEDGVTYKRPAVRRDAGIRERVSAISMVPAKPKE